MLTNGVGNAIRFSIFATDNARLSATGNTTAAASHDFDKVIRQFFAVGFGCANAIENFFNITDTMSNGNANLSSVDGNFGFFDTVKTFNVFEFGLSQLLSGNVIISRTQCRSHPFAPR